MRTRTRGIMLLKFLFKDFKYINITRQKTIREVSNHE